MIDLAIQEEMARKDYPGKFQLGAKILGITAMAALINNYVPFDKLYALSTAISLSAYNYLPGVRGTFQLTGNLLGEAYESTITTIKGLKITGKDVIRTAIKGTMVLDDLIE